MDSAPSTSRIAAYGTTSRKACPWKIADHPSLSVHETSRNFEPDPYVPGLDDYISLDQTLPHGKHHSDKHVPRRTAKLENPTDVESVSQALEEPMMPSEIRLKRPSSPLNLQQWVLKSCRQGFTDPDYPPRKSSGVGPVTTRTFVHFFLPENSSQRDSLQDVEGRRRSATLCVVRSHDSVYEVIWEDEFEPNANNRSVSISSQLPMSKDDSARETPPQIRSDSLSTKLSSWSWGGEMTLTFPSFQHSSAVASSFTPFSHEDAASSESSGGSRTCQVPKLSEEMSTTHHDKTDQQGLAGTAAAIQSTATKPSKPLKVSEVNRIGRPKLNCLPPKLDHFQNHRDSLLLARHRLFQDQQHCSNTFSKRRVNHTKERPKPVPALHSEDEESAAANLRRAPVCRAASAITPMSVIVGPSEVSEGSYPARVGSKKGNQVRIDPVAKQNQPVEACGSLARSLQIE